LNIPPKLDRQREHQANERTFLAWVRTSIALISFGLAIARFGLFLRQIQMSMTGTEAAHGLINSQLIGVMLVAAGLVLIGLATWSHNRAFWQIERGNYQPSRWVIWLTAAIVLLLGLLSLPFILWQPLEPSVPRRTTQPQSRLEKKLPLFGMGRGKF
jgi:putative membrane protein